MAILPGSTLGPYEIISELGAGGMGIVYRARDTRLDRDVAIKVLPEHVAGDADLRQRFEREARAVAGLSHPNICTLHDIGEQDGQPFLALELLEGSSLAERLGNQPVRLEQLLEWGVQLADALAAAHAKGIVHRDIKPGNVFVTTAGPVKMLDFGLAKPGAAGPEVGGGAGFDRPTVLNEHLTTPGMALGTVAYMSPEQVRGEELDARTDLFSLGVVLYELATGSLPFTGQTGAVAVDHLLNRPPPPPQQVNADVPAELARIIDKALEKDRRLRYQTAADIRSDLMRLRRDSGSHPVEAARISVARAETASLRIVHPWEAVARDGRDFAGQGAGIMYWFRVPLGGICYQDGFRNALQPALENPRISQVRFVLDSSVPAIHEAWNALVLPLLEAWSKHADREIEIDRQDDEGRVVDRGTGATLLTWVAVDLSEEFSPCFKLLVDDPGLDEPGEPQAQVFLSTATRTVRFGDGSRHTIRIPDTILRVRASDDASLLDALSRIASQWDLL